MKLQIKFNDTSGEYKNPEQNITIDLETKEIIGNEDGLGIWSKLVDTGVYTLFTEDGVITIVDDYVPDCIPNEYGDYIDLDVKDGKVINWTSTTEEIIAEFTKKGK